jgi:hypothetical protein
LQAAIIKTAMAEAIITKMNKIAIKDSNFLFLVLTILRELKN